MCNTKIVCSLLVMLRSIVESRYCLPDPFISRSLSTFYLVYLAAINNVVVSIIKGRKMLSFLIIKMIIL